VLGIRGDCDKKLIMTRRVGSPGNRL